MVRSRCFHTRSSGSRSYKVCVIWCQYNVHPTFLAQMLIRLYRCPGLTSKGARMDGDIPVDAVVAVMAEGKDHSMAVGQMKMSNGDIRAINKGIGVETLTALG